MSLVTVRLAVDCYDDTHYTSGTYDKVRERQMKAKELYKALQGFQCTEDCTPLVRVKNRDYSAGKHQGVRDGLFLHAA